MGSRFENLSGHDRSCILSGQHRNGRCACRINSRDTNSNDDTNARASISRIVMLAEALFEVSSMHCVSCSGGHRFIIIQVEYLYIF